MRFGQNQVCQITTCSFLKALFRSRTNRRKMRLTWNGGRYPHRDAEGQPRRCALIKTQTQVETKEPANKSQG